MRFISEFDLKPPYTLDRPEAHMLSMEADMGRMIGASFGWKHVGFTNLNKDYAGERWTLEIEAFPIDKWVEFKRNIATLIMSNCDELSGDVIKLLNELESFGNPAGAAKEL